MVALEIKMQQLELRIPPLLLMMAVALFMVLMVQSWPMFHFTLPFGHWLALSFLLFGVVVALLGVLTFRRANTTVDPRYPEKSASLVVSGIYRYSRNPMYLGFLLILLAVACFLAHALAFVWLPLFVLYMNRFQILPEERFMQQKFAAQFSQYKTQVRRWL